MTNQSLHSLMSCAESVTRFLSTLEIVSQKFQPLRVIVWWLVGFRGKSTAQENSSRSLSILENDLMSDRCVGTTHPILEQNAKRLSFKP